MTTTYSNKEIWHVTYPIFLGLIAQNVINVTDTAFLGHVSEVALGAAAMGGLLYICFYTVAFALYLFLYRGVRLQCRFADHDRTP